MTSLDTTRFRDLLLADEQDTLRLMANLGEDIDAMVGARQDSNNDDEHDPEGVTIAYERSQSDALLRQSKQRLVEIADALVRIDEGTYGTCASCGKHIGRARLTARPYTRLCIECASAA